jgi:hypothetical protein
MHSFVYATAASLLIVGVVTSIWSRRYLTETGRTLPWYKRVSPVWIANPYYTPVGQRLARVSGITASLGALIYLVSRLAQ